MSKAIISEVPRNLLFKYLVRCKYHKKPWTEKLRLGEEYKLPSFGNFEDQLEYADVRMAWNEKGLFLNVHVDGKKKSLWCRSTQLLESDGVQLWIDTRNTQSIHRASKFCHYFLLLPAGSGANNEEPIKTMLRINRAKDDPPTFNPKSVSLAVATKLNSYLLTAFIPGTCLNGWNTDDHRKIGFNYAVIDRELGWQTLATGPEMPINEDPSLWHTLHLVD